MVFIFYPIPRNYSYLNLVFIVIAIFCFYIQILLLLQETRFPNSVPPPRIGIGNLSKEGKLNMQSQVVCSGCRSILLYPRGATNVCCALCSTVTQVPLHGTEMAQLVCGSCRTLLMYTRGATSVRCSCCHTVSLAPASNNIAHICCEHCHTTLMYPCGAPSVKCAICQYVTNVGMSNARVPLPVNDRTNGISTSTRQTVVVENPMSVDKSGKFVSNYMVGVTTENK